MSTSSRRRSTTRRLESIKTSTSGLAVLKSFKRLTSQAAAKEGSTESLSDGLSSRRRIALTAPDSCVNAPCSSGSPAWPAAVSAMPRPRRSTSGAPTAASSF